jgi:hypothetical protein
MLIIIEQCIDCLLEHAHFIVNYGIGVFQAQEIFQAIISIDNPAVSIISVTGSNTSPIQGDQGTQIERNNW